MFGNDKKDEQIDSVLDAVGERCVGLGVRAVLIL